MAKHDTNLDRLFHALSDPTRRSFMERLIDSPASVTELAAPTGMSLPTVLRHIEVLEETGLVRTEKTGRKRMCHATPAPLSEANGWIEQQRAIWEARLDRLEAYLATLEPEENARND